MYMHAHQIYRWCLSLLLEIKVVNIFRHISRYLSVKLYNFSMSTNVKIDPNHTYYFSQNICKHTRACACTYTHTHTHTHTHAHTRARAYIEREKKEKERREKFM